MEIPLARGDDVVPIPRNSRGLAVALVLAPGVVVVVLVLVVVVVPLGLAMAVPVAVPLLPKMGVMAAVWWYDWLGVVTDEL